MERKQFRVEVQDYIAVVTHDRPPVNAHNTDARIEFTDIFDELNEREDVRVVILTSSGKIFSAGADIKERSSLGERVGDFSRHNRRTREYFAAIADCSKPVIAAVNGAAIGAGFGIAMSSDIIIAAESAYFAMTELNVGIAGGGGFLMRHLPKTKTRAMYFTGWNYSAKELQQLGVVESVVPDTDLLNEAMRFASAIAEKSPLAVQAAKKAFQTIAEMPMHDAYKYEQSVTRMLAGTNDAKEAQQAFIEKRKPNFTNS